MREQIMCGIERSEMISRQFGLHRFEDDPESWWPASMRVDNRKKTHNGAARKPKTVVSNLQQ